MTAYYNVHGRPPTSLSTGTLDILTTLAGVEFAGETADQSSKEKVLAQLRDKIMRDADVLVPCWGRRDKVPKQHRGHIDDLVAMLQASMKPVKAFGFAMGGDPLHPLMLGYDTKLVCWEARS